MIDESLIETGEAELVPLLETKAVIESLRQINSETIFDLHPGLLTLLGFHPVKDESLLPQFLAVLEQPDVVEASSFLATSLGPWSAESLAQVETLFVEPLKMWQRGEIGRLTRSSAFGEHLTNDPAAIDDYLQATTPVRFKAEERAGVFLSQHARTVNITDQGVRVRAVEVDPSSFRRFTPFFAERASCPLGEQIIKNASRSAIASAKTQEQKEQVFQALCATATSELKWWNLNDSYFSIEVSSCFQKKRGGFPETPEEVWARPLLLDLWLLLLEHFPYSESIEFVLNSLASKLHQQAKLSEKLLNYTEAASLQTILGAYAYPEQYPLIEPLPVLKALTQELIRSLGALAARVDKEAVFRKVLEFRRSNDFIEERVADLLLYPQEMAVDRAEIKEGAFQYYGQGLEIEGLEPNRVFFASEIAPFLLVVKDERGKIEGGVNLYPNFYKEEIDQKAYLTSEEEAINSFLRPDQKCSPKEIATFLANHDQVFAKGARFYQALWQPYLNPAIFSLEARIKVTNFLAQANEQETERFYQAIERIGIDAFYVLAAGSDKEIFKALLDFCSDQDQEFVRACFNLIAEVEELSWEMAIAITPKKRLSVKRVGQYASFILQQERAVVAEIAKKLKEASFNEKDKGLILEILVRNRQALMAMVYKARGLPLPRVEIDWDILEKMEILYQDYPGMFASLLFYQNAIEAAKEAGAPPEETARKIERAYGARVVDIFAEASKFTADTEKEIEETVETIKTLTDQGLQGVKLPPNLRVLDAGCAFGNRVLGPVCKRLKELGISIAQVTGVDLREEINQAASEGRLDKTIDRFIYSDIAYLFRLLEDQEKFNLCLNLWSSSLDPQEVTSQIKFHLGVAKVLEKGAVYLIDFAPLAEVPQKIRSHFEAAKEYHQAHPEQALGLKPPPPEYRTGRATDQKPDALIDSPYALLELLERMGFKPLNIDGYTLKQQLKKIKEGDLSLLYEEGKAISSALYLTCSGWIRARLILVKEKEPEESFDPLIQEILADLKEEPIPSRYKDA